MSTTPIYAHAVPISHLENSSWPWIIVIIILIIVIIALAIWLIVRHVNDNNSGSRTVTIQGGSITSSSSSITGSWGTLGSETDKVTLYVSPNPLVFNNDGTVVCPSSTCQSATGTGSNNSVTISNLTINTTYNAVLVTGAENTNHYAIFGPRKVFTQETAQLANILFNIKDLNNPTGSVSNTGTYTDSSTNIGIFRYGPQASNANSSSKSFLVKYENENDVSEDPTLILCRSFTGLAPLSTNIILAEWDNFGDITDAPKIYAQGADKTAVNQIPVNYCEWNYNDAPPDGAEGKNSWCLQATQSTSINNTTLKESLCMARNGNSLDLVTPSIATTWYNQKFADSPVT